MIVNSKDFPWQVNLSVEELLKQLKYSYPDLLVSINGDIISKYEYKVVVLKETDVVKVIHPIVGG